MLYKFNHQGLANFLSVMRFFYFTRQTMAPDADKQQKSFKRIMTHTSIKREIFALSFKRILTKARNPQSDFRIRLLSKHNKRIAI